MERRCRSEPCAGWAMSPNSSTRTATVIRALGQRLSLPSKLLLFIGALSLGGPIVFPVAALESGRRAADQVYNQLLAGSALAIEATGNLIDMNPAAALPYHPQPIQSTAPHDRLFS